MHQIIEGLHALTAKLAFIFTAIVLALELLILVHSVGLVFTILSWQLNCHIVCLVNAN